MMFVDTSTYSVDYSADSSNRATPPTPSSSFESSYLENNQDLIDVILLCYWDNILGPRIHHLWQTAAGETLSASTALYLGTKTMSGEICRELCDSGVDYKLYSIADKQLLVLALVFSTMDVCGLGVNALLVVMTMDKRARYLQKHELMLHWFKRIIAKLKVYVSKDTIQNAVNLFSVDLKNFLVMMTSLHEDGLPPVIQLSETALSTNHTLDEEFLRQALASHLITMGRSVIVGKHAPSINVLISTLALFNAESERVCSRYVNHDPSKVYPYHQDLWLQGLTKGRENVLSTLTTEILSSQYPTTIVDVENGEVFQSTSFPEHLKWHHRTRVSELTALYINDVEKLTFPKGMFAAFEYAETFIQSCLLEVGMLQGDCGVRESYIEHLKMFLNRKALALVTYLEAETDCGTNPARVNLKKVKQDQGLTLEGNFRIVLAVAEKLKPGLYSYLLGDRRDGELVYSLDGSIRASQSGVV